MALSQNLQLAGNVEALAAKKGCTPGQLALAWVSQEHGILTWHGLHNVACRGMPHAEAGRTG